VDWPAPARRGESYNRYRPHNRQTFAEDKDFQFQASSLPLGVMDRSHETRQERRMQAFLAQTAKMA
jgi:hypothetical protein